MVDRRVRLVKMIQAARLLSTELEIELQEYDQQQLRDLNQTRLMKSSNQAKEKAKAVRQHDNIADLYQAQLDQNGEIKNSQEHFTKLDMHSTEVWPDKMSRLAKNRQFIKIEDLMGSYNGDDIPGDWITIGVICQRPIILPTEKGTKIMVLLVTDLQGNFFRLLLSQKVLDAIEATNYEVGSVVAILNAKLIKPSESRGALALHLDSIDYYLVLGKSLHLGWCKSGQCKEVVHTLTTAIYCHKHLEKLHTAARGKRQELATGNQTFQIGPSDKVQKKKERSYENHATYNVKGDTLVAEGTRASFRSPLKPSSQRTDKNQLHAILKSNDRGGYAVSKALGLEAPNVPDPNFFGPKALAKMGGNPLIKENSPKKSPSKEAPSRDSPLKRKSKVDSDSDEFEIVITG